MARPFAIFFLLRFAILAMAVHVHASGFEHGGVYSIRSTSSALMFGLRNGSSAVNVPIVSQSALSGAGSCSQNWETIESSVNPGFFYIRGGQDGENGVSLVLDIEGVDNLVYHKADEGVSRQRWTFDEICGTGSGLIRNQRSSSLCVQDNGRGEILTGAECDVANGAMLWKIRAIDEPDEAC